MQNKICIVVFQILQRCEFFGQIQVFSLRTQDKIPLLFLSFKTLR